MESILKMFKAGMKMIDITTFYSMTIKPISPPGLEYKIKKELGAEEYKKIRQENIKHKGHQKRYKTDKNYRENTKKRANKKYAKRIHSN